MYDITRQQAADLLNVSTRSVDRYVKSGKLRSKKEGKIIYIHRGDINSISGKEASKQEVIIPRTNSTVESPSTSISSPSQNGGTLEKIYADLRSEIQKKDTLIQNLSVQLGEAKEVARNSVTLVEFKKSQFLLEESKGYLGREVEDIKEAKDDLEKKLKYEKSTNYILITFVVILFLTLAFVWFVKI